MHLQTPLGPKGGASRDSFTNLSAVAMQNLSATCRVLYENFSQTEREQRNKEADIRREVERARMTAEDARSRLHTEQTEHHALEAHMRRQIVSLDARIEDLMTNVDQLEAAFDEQALEHEENQEEMAEETSKLERLCEETQDDLRKANEIIEEAGDQVRELIRLMKERHSDMDDGVYTSMMRLLNTSHSVLLRR